MSLNEVLSWQSQKNHEFNTNLMYIVRLCLTKERGEERGERKSYRIGENICDRCS